MVKARREEQRTLKLVNAVELAVVVNFAACYRYDSEPFWVARIDKPFFADLGFWHKSS